MSAREIKGNSFKNAVRISAIFAALILLCVMFTACSVQTEIRYSVDGEIVHIAEVDEKSGYEEYEPELEEGYFAGWYTDEACTVPFDYHSYIIGEGRGDITLYALITEREEEECAHEGLEYVEGEAATCTEAGIRSHYYCPECGKTYADSRCTAECETDVAPLGHKLRYEEGQAATCKADGRVAHYHCSRCGVDFKDEACVFFYDDVVIPKKEHVLRYCAEKAASCSAEGQAEHWQCTLCEELYADEDGEEVVTEQELVLGRTSHDYTYRITQYPSKEREGEVEVYCRDCEESYTEALPVLSAEEYYVTETESTCIQEGKTEYVLEDSEYYVRVTEYKELGAHKPSAELGAVEPTCVKDGNTGQVVCLVCHMVMQSPQIITRLGHDYEEAGYLIEPTCTQEGIASYECTRCGEEKTLHVAKAAHSLTIVTGREATCTEEGREEHMICTECGAMFFGDDLANEIGEEDIILKELGHDVEYEQEVPATCTSGGRKAYYYCKRCGKRYEDEACTRESKDIVIPQLEHVLQKRERTESTCAQSGMAQHWECVLCGALFADEAGEDVTTEQELALPLAEHEYSCRISKYPTKSEEGELELTCGVCGDTRTEPLPKLNETDYAVTTTSSTCAENGKEEYVLRDSEYEVRVVLQNALAAHTPSERKGEAEATCEIDGSTGYVVCTVCGEVLEEERILPKLGHEYVEESRTDATCESEGKITRECKRCGDVEEEVVPMLAHTLQVVAAKTATCMRDGWIEHLTCTECGAMFSAKDPEERLSESSVKLEKTGEHAILENSYLCSLCGVKDGVFSFNENETGYTLVGVDTYNESVLTIPDEVNGMPVTELADSAELFGGCYAITGLAVPDSVTYIPEGSFSILTELQTLTVPFIGTTRDEPTTLAAMFGEPTNARVTVQEVTVTDATKIPDRAFESAVKITKILINEGCTSIGARAFATCANLQDLYLPSTLESISADAFQRVNADMNIHFAGTEQQWLELTQDVALPENANVMFGG